ncbi:SDR family oxidoreductase [Williamsia sp. M5A3_1d]
MVGNVLVVIGVGGMGEAIARRLGSGRPLVLADHDDARLQAVSSTLRRQGFDVRDRTVDVSDRASVRDLADFAQRLGEVTAVAHTAGLSPAQASAERIAAVDLVGAAISLDEFGEVIAPGGAGVYIASIAGHIFRDAVDTATAATFATAPAEELAAVALLSMPDLPADLARAMTYGYAKRANQIRVQAQAPRWGDRGARVNSISPGVVATPMGWDEYEADFAHDAYKSMVTDNAAGRFGTAEDVAAAADFLLDPTKSGFITGTDLLVDGGTLAGIGTGRVSMGPAENPA